MKKKIFWIIVIALAALLAQAGYFKLLPYWASTLSVIALATGVIVGWIGKAAYDKYIKDDSGKP